MFCSCCWDICGSVKMLLLTLAVTWDHTAFVMKTKLQDSSYKKLSLVTSQLWRQFIWWPHGATFQDMWLAFCEIVTLLCLWWLLKASLRYFYVGNPCLNKITAYFQWTFKWGNKREILDYLWGSSVPVERALMWKEKCIDWWGKCKE